MGDRMQTEEEYKACLSLQRALLGVVTKSLRAVSFVLSENFIAIYFFYDGEISEKEEELAWDVAAEVIADFPSSYMVSSKVIQVNYPQKIDVKGRTVFRRKE